MQRLLMEKSLFDLVNLDFSFEVEVPSDAFFKLGPCIVYFDKLEFTIMNIVSIGKLPQKENDRKIVSFEDEKIKAKIKKSTKNFYDFSNSSSSVILVLTRAKARINDVKQCV